MCPQTNWRSHTTLLSLSLYNRNSSCRFLECPVSLLSYFSFLFVWMGAVCGRERCMLGKSCAIRKHRRSSLYVPHMGYRTLSDPQRLLGLLPPPTQATHLLTPVSKENSSAAAKQSQADCTSELFSTSTLRPDQTLYRGIESHHLKQWFVDWGRQKPKAWDWWNKPISILLLLFRNMSLSLGSYTCTWWNTCRPQTSWSIRSWTIQIIQPLFTV